jgi:hypothetical protein
MMYGAEVCVCSEKNTRHINAASYLQRTPHRGADKSLARPGRKQATATEDLEFHISYL